MHQHESLAIPTKASAWPPIRLGLMLYVPLGLALGAYGPALEQLREEFTISYGAVSGIFVASSAGFLVAAALGGQASDKLGRRRVFMAGAATAVFGLAFSAVAWSFLVYLVATFLVGMGFGLCEPTITAWVSNAAGERAGRAISIMQVGFAVGALLGPLVVGGLLAMGWGWRPAFGLAAILVAPSIIVAGLITDSPAPAPADAAESRNVFRMGIVWMLGRMLALYVGFEAGFAGFFAAFLESSFGTLRASSASWVTVFWIGQLVGRIFGAWLAGRTDLVGLALGTLTLAAAGALVAGMAPAFELALAGAAIAGLTSGAVFPTIMAIGVRRVPHAPGAVSGLMFACAGGGSLLFPLMVGSVADAINVRAGLLVLPTLLAVAVGLLIFARERDLRVRGESPVASPESSASAIHQDPNVMGGPPSEAGHRPE